MVAIDIILILKTFFFWFPISILLAWIEIEIEGPFTWMRGNPNTVRINSKILKIIFGSKKNYTWYHLCMFFLLLVVAMQPTWEKIGTADGWEIGKTVFKSLGIYIFFINFLEDLLYFVFNENYGVTAMKKELKLWNTSWVLGIPLGYIECVVLSGSLLCLSVGLVNCIGIFLLSTIGSFACIALAPKYHRFRRRGLAANKRKEAN